jgi:predicted nucleic acid-binding Zn ribbon protein
MNAFFPFQQQRTRASEVPISARQRVLAQWRGWDSAPEEIARKASEKPVADVLQRVLAGMKMDRRQSESEILKVWDNLIDPRITAHARPTGIHKGTLFVSVDSSVWLDEIVRYRRREILERLQNSFGREMIAKISFRVG